jgi:ankyrin repeat protein
MASKDGHVEVVRLLLARQGVELNQAIANGAMALYFASQNGHVEVVQLLEQVSAPPVCGRLDG